MSSFLGVSHRTGEGHAPEGRRCATGGTRGDGGCIPVPAGDALPASVSPASSSASPAASSAASGSAEECGASLGSQNPAHGSLASSFPLLPPFLSSSFLFPWRPPADDGRHRAMSGEERAQDTIPAVSRCLFSSERFAFSLESAVSFPSSPPREGGGEPDDEGARDEAEEAACARKADASGGDSEPETTREATGDGHWSKKRDTAPATTAASHLPSASSHALNRHLGTPGDYCVPAAFPQESASDRSLSPQLPAARVDEAACEQKDDAFGSASASGEPSDPRAGGGAGLQTRLCRREASSASHTRAEERGEEARADSQPAQETPVSAETNAESQVDRGAASGEIRRDAALRGDQDAQPGGGQKDVQTGTSVRGVPADDAAAEGGASAPREGAKEKKGLERQRGDGGAEQGLGSQRCGCAESPGGRHVAAADVLLSSSSFCSSHSSLSPLSLDASTEGAANGAAEEYDRYGFRVSDSERLGVTAREYSLKIQPETRTRDERWSAFVLRDPTLSDRQTLKRLVRSGVPDSLRQEVWSRCLGSWALREQRPILFEELTQRPLPKNAAEQIELDLRRTFPSNKRVRAEAAGIADLRRVLHAFATYKPKVNYCQSMNFLAATLLLFMPEDLAFWSLVQLIDSEVPGKGLTLESYYTPGMDGLRRDLKVLDMLLAKRLPRVVRTLRRTQVDLDCLCAEWFLSLYSSSLPIYTTFRIWDALALEGHKILFRVALAIFSMHEEEFASLTSLEEVMTFLRRMTRHLVARNELMTVAFTGLGRLSRREVARLQLRAAAQVQAENRAHEERRRAYSRAYSAAGGGQGRDAAARARPRVQEETVSDAGACSEAASSSPPGAGEGRLPRGLAAAPWAARWTRFADLASRWRGRADRPARHSRFPLFARPRQAAPVPRSRSDAGLASHAARRENVKTLAAAEELAAKLRRRLFFRHRGAPPGEEAESRDDASDPAGSQRGKREVAVDAANEGGSRGRQNPRESEPQPRQRDAGERQATRKKRLTLGAGKRGERPTRWRLRDRRLAGSGSGNRREKIGKRE
ncbi:hypothetical protein BESB_084880 [Besnoitia besnoiti]|uniref:Rab-GAP TBC domain-containing protein n=1 Tax=Besnoitia besnoiti TaxID=94643 RepID=A0A2A9M5S0_BESBE|nr:hypothetical protein BESB_084880 [Besnoitia besnoiti]PFH33289.1 hypothetical protein BESB_084880 [Besnoitia besnoiti]